MSTPGREPEADTQLPPLLAGKRPRRLLGLVLNGVGQAAAAIGGALLVKNVFDRVVAGGAAGSLEALAPLGAALAGTAVLVGVLRSRERADAERLGQSYVHALRNAMYRRLSDLAPRALQGRSQGAVMLRFVGDLTAIARWVSLGLSRAIVGGTFVVGALGALALISAGLAAGVTVVLLLGAIAALASARSLQTRSREARRRRARLAANVNEKVGSIGVVQVFGQTARERARLKAQSRKLRYAMIDRARSVGHQRGLAEGTAMMASVAVLMVGAAEVGAGRATPGTVVAAMTIVGLLAGPLRDLGRVNEYWHNSRISMEKCRSFLETPNLLRHTPEAPDLEPGPGRLEFEDVHFEGSLRSVSAVAEPGSLVVVVGPNGAGKSTLLSLAARLMDPDRGVVRLDGQDLAERGETSVRRAMSMVGPDLPLLRGTVEENLRYRCPDAPQEEIDRVAALCSLDGLLAELPEGIETRVVEGGTNLSAGQRQRLSMARALVGEPAVLLLDEADANLDEEARALVDRIVKTQRGRRTVLMVSHQAAVLEWADAIWHLEDGRLVDASVAGSASPTPNATG
ncbi:MAG: ABC transporter ATP-binding protein [Thermoleophilaceae bacterium]